MPVQSTKVAIVTGAARGIGRAIALNLLVMVTTLSSSICWSQNSRKRRKWSRWLG